MRFRNWTRFRKPGFSKHSNPRFRKPRFMKPNHSGNWLHARQEGFITPVHSARMEHHASLHQEENVKEAIFEGVRLAWESDRWRMVGNTTAEKELVNVSQWRHWLCSHQTASDDLKHPRIVVLDNPKHRELGATAAHLSLTYLLQHVEHCIREVVVRATTQGAKPSLQPSEISHNGSWPSAAAAHFHNSYRVTCALQLIMQTLIISPFGCVHA